MKKGFLAHELHVYEMYFNKHIDGLNEIDAIKRKYGGENVIVLYFGNSYSDYGLYDYRLTIQIDIAHHL